MTSTWSLSSLGTYEKCGLKYRFRYVEKIPEQRSTQANRGVDNHAIVEGYLNGNISDLPDNLSFYKAFLEGLKQYEIYPEHRISLTRQWTPTTWGAENAWFRGILDLKLRKGDEAIVYDWKTGKIYPDHDDQKSIYSLATFSENPSLLRVRAVHVYFDLNKNREQTFDRGEVHQLRKHWEDRVAKLEQDPQYIANPGFHCRYCSYRRENGGPCNF